MNSITANAQTPPADPPRGGYSDRRLWPCYMVGSAIAMLAAPFIGEFFAMVLVMVPALYIAAKVAARQAKDPNHHGHAIIFELYDGIKKRDKREAREAKRVAERMALHEDVPDCKATNRKPRPVITAATKAA